MDRKTRRLFVGGRNPKMLVMMNADTGKVIGEPFPIGDRVDANVFDPATNMVASATREGTLHIFHEDSPDKLSVVETVKTEFGAKTMGFDPKTHKLFLTTSDFGPAPAPTEKQPNPQPVATPGTFRLLIYGSDETLHGQRFGQDSMGKSRQRILRANATFPASKIGMSVTNRRSELNRILNRNGGSMKRMKCC